MWSWPSIFLWAIRGKNIFDKYYKSAKKHKRNLYGTGLGLSIVKSIFILHNYEYGVTTKKGKGTSFYFYI